MKSDFQAFVAEKRSLRSHTNQIFHLTNVKTKWSPGLCDTLSQTYWCKTCHYAHGFYVREFRKGTMEPAFSSPWGWGFIGEIQSQGVTLAGAGISQRLILSYAWHLVWQDTKTIDKSVDFSLSTWFSPSWKPQDGYFSHSAVKLQEWLFQQTWSQLRGFLWSILGRHLTSFPLHFFMFITELKFMQTPPEGEKSTKVTLQRSLWDGRNCCHYLWKV